MNRIGHRTTRLKGPQEACEVLPEAPTGLMEQIGDEIRSGVPPAEHRCPNLDIRESTVPARSNMNRIDRRTIMCMLLIAALALIWNGQ